LFFYILQIKEELHRAEQKLESTTSRVISRGFTEVKRIAREHNIQGVHGMVIELFKCKEKYNRAVEVTAGQSLFHIVVDSDQIAAQILKIMNQEKKQGRVSFMPLNRITVPSLKENIGEEQFIPLWKKIEYRDQKFAPVFNHIFGRTFVCESIETGSQFARDNDVDCVTFDGNQINRRGALTGGFVDVRQSRMEAQKNIAKYRNKGSEEEDKYGKVRARLRNLDQKISTTVGELHKIETEVHRLRNVLQQEQTDLR
jgi:structural maintenance of chromosome 3 (chondroitin sulfate proteoglycan 6)